MKKKNKKTICFDLDGTLCTQCNGVYNKAKPIRNAIQKVNKLYDNGNRIIIYTARYMGRTNGNIKAVYKMGYKKTLKQLKKWNVSFHYLIMGKPSCDLFVDDKAFGYSKKWISKKF